MRRWTLRKPFRDRRTGVLVAVCLGYFVVAGILMSRPRPPETQETAGILVEVQAQEIVNAQQVTLRSLDGTERIFQVSPEVANNPEHPNTASHLRQHMIGADPVIVRYRSSDGGSMAVRIMDADAARAP